MGSAAESNTVGINTFNSNPDRATDVLVGGLNPEDRNLISGNTSTTQTTATASYPGPGWIIQGNYIGVGADGLTGIANSVIDGSGTLSIDNVPDVIVGGPQPTAINVIGSSLGHGIAPHNSDNLLIENNYIGLGYDGTTILGSGNTGIGTGITLTSSHNVTIKNNRVAGWDQGGMDINSDNSDLSIENNIIHDNEANGIEISASENIQVVGNTIYNNQDVSISVFGMSLFGIVTDDVSITGNKVGLDINGTPTPNNPVGINVFGDPTNVIIGGTSPADANHIASSTGSGITTMGFDVPAMSLSGSPQKVSILGNSIYDTSPASDPSTGAGLGIDLMVGIETDSIPDGIPNTYTSSGPTPNDPTDSDTGPNNYINFPTLNSVTQDGTTATINFNLDAADSPTDQYRVEFFANDQADPSGYGEGQTFLGFATVSNGITNKPASRFQTTST
ncbi:MAG: right-handed parallel beta-helix repeat-containing protein [Candidatus Saccharimonadales bacterium]